jgi:H+/Na+-translocating ferredoxin:NAD+ oxidoreductase subunit G
MREMINMIVVLTILGAVSGGLLAATKDWTDPKIEYQQLTFVKGPAIKSILEGAANDPIVDRFKIEHDGKESSFFVGIFNGEPSAIAFEGSGKGFGGDIGLMMGVTLADDKLIGVGVTTHSETPGIGSKAKTDPTFTNQFKGMQLTAVTDVDVISGATVTSNGINGAVAAASQRYQSLKPQILEQLKAFK